jgi:transcriptional repressor NF-X1
LVERLCICGKKKLTNQPCWFEEGRCGLTCGKKLKCGAHECRKSCHKPGECEDANMTGTHCSQPCGKPRKSCEHTCVDECHAPYPCKEDKPCQSKTIITCPCQRRKQEVRCLASRLAPPPEREPLKCDDECLRLQRNRKLAEALDIDPATHTDNHIPYSDTTLKLFRENMAWAQEQERELRVFAGSPEEKRLRFKPMPAHQRAFIHSLAEDFGLDTESMDPEPHRHVCIFKTPRFVSAPNKTLAQCLRIAQQAANLGTGTSAIKQQPPAAKRPQPQPFNAILLISPRFGLTIDELDTALAADLSSAGRSGPAMTFTTSFLPSAEEVIIKAVPKPVTAASIATSTAATPEAIERALSVAKPAIAKTVSRLGLAGSVMLCHVEGVSDTVTRREADGAAGGGWSAVASRGAWKKVAMNKPNTVVAEKAVEERRAPSAFVALRKLGEKKAAGATTPTTGSSTGGVGLGAGVKEKGKDKKEEEVEEDWLAAVEREEGEAAGEEKNLEEESGNGQVGGSGDSETPAAIVA